MSFYRGIFLFLTLTLSVASSIAQQNGSFDPRPGDSTSRSKFYVMSMEELLNVVVKVASKDKEKLADAPGMVTSYSAKDFERFGYYTLKDIASVTSGYSTFSAYGETNLETRGQKAGSWEANKHLLLIDGIPVNHARANSAPLEYQVPLFFAGSAEFLKGPGSALYGNSAFYGVMNLTSKELEGPGTLFEWKSSYGDLGIGTRLMLNAISKTEEGHLDLSASYYERGFGEDSLGFVNTNRLYDDDKSVFLKTSYTVDKAAMKGFSVGVIFMNRESHGGEFWGAYPSPNNKINWRQFVTYFKYDRELSENLFLHSYISNNISREESSYFASWANFGLGSVPSAGYSFATIEQDALFELKYKISDKSSWVTGLNFNTRKENRDVPLSYQWSISVPDDTLTSSNFLANFSVPAPGVRVNVMSAYTQYKNEYDILEGLLFTAGLRFDNGMSEVGQYSQFSPRLALVQKVSKKLNFKLLYGQALRVPLSKEIGLNGATIDEIDEKGGTGNSSDIPVVGPEIIKSLEAGVNYTQERFSASLSVFLNRTDNSLDGAQYSYVAGNGDTLNPNYFRNLGLKIDAKGFEYDLQYLIKDRMKLVVNQSFALASLRDSVNFQNVPTHKSNLMFTYNVKGKMGFSTTIIARRIWAFRVAEGLYDESLMLDRDPGLLAGYTMLDLNVLLPLTSNFGLEFQVRNLLNTQWKQPSLLGPTSMIPLQRRNFMASLSVKF